MSDIRVSEHIFVSRSDYNKYAEVSMHNAGVTLNISRETLKNRIDETFSKKDDRSKVEDLVNTAIKAGMNVIAENYELTPRMELSGTAVEEELKRRYVPSPVEELWDAVST